MAMDQSGDPRFTDFDMGSQPHRGLGRVTIRRLAGTLARRSLGMRLLRTAFGAEALVLMFHRFTTDRSHPFHLPQSDLATIIGTLKSAAVRFVPIEALLAGGFAEDRSSPLVAITIDDGYADFHSVALPVLQAFRVPSTLFVSTGPVLARDWFWWDRLEYALGASRRPCVQLPEALGGGRIDVPRSAEDRIKLSKALASRLVLAPPAVRDEAILHVCTQADISLPAEAAAEFAAVRPEQLRSYEDYGVRVGAHTVNHPTLSTLSADAAEQEIMGSVGAVAALVREPSTVFCYPNGTRNDFTADHAELLQRAGISFAVTTHPGYIAPDHFVVARSPACSIPSAYDVPRFPVESAEQALIDIAGFPLVRRGRWSRRARWELGAPDR